MKQKSVVKIIKYFDSLIEKTLLKLKDKINIFFEKNSKVSSFNKLLITLVSLLFIYLFYLSIPTLYNKTWIQNSIENKLINEFNINFSISSDITYRILPSPHFLIKDSKIFKDNVDKVISLSEIKNLKVFINQKNFFDKNKMNINKVVIDNANFTLSRKDLKLLNVSANDKFSHKVIKVNNSNIFFKDMKKETIAIIKISKAQFFFDKFKLVNIFSLNGEAFKIPFTLELNKQIYSTKNKEVRLRAPKLKLNILNESQNKNNNLISGKNMISFLNNKIYTKYNIKKNLIIFSSHDSKIKESNINYNGELSINPFDLRFNMDLENYELFKLFDQDSIFAEFIKTKLFFNENISINSSITLSPNILETMYHTAKINLNIINGRINLDHTKIINEKIGTLVLDNSNLFFKNDKLFFNTDIRINIQNSNNLFTYLQTVKKFRKPIKNIFINIEYDFLNKKIKFNNLLIDGLKVNNEILTLIEEFNDDDKKNLNKSKRIINKLFSVYSG